MATLEFCQGDPYLFALIQDLFSIQQSIVVSIGNLIIPISYSNQYQR